MSDKVIVTIDREFGSGGHEVARRLAERLNIPFYDEEIIARAAASTGYNAEYIRDNDEKAPDYSFSSVFSGFDSFQTSPFAQLTTSSLKSATSAYSCLRRLKKESEENSRSTTQLSLRTCLTLLLLRSR